MLSLFLQSPNPELCGPRTAAAPAAEMGQQAEASTLWWLFTATCNLFISAAGAGLLAYPLAAMYEGVGMLILTTILFACINVYTDCILAWASGRALAAGTIRAGTYEEVAWRSLDAYFSRVKTVSPSSTSPSTTTYGFGDGSGWVRDNVSGTPWTGGKMAYLVAVATVLIGCFGSIIGFMIIIGDMASPVVAEMCAGSTHVSAAACDALSSRAVTTFAFATIFALPISHCSRMHNLWFSSFLAAATVIAVGVLVVTRGANAVMDAGGMVPSAIDVAAETASMDAARTLLDVTRAGGAGVSAGISALLSGFGNSTGTATEPPVIFGSGFPVMLGLPISVFSLGNHIQCVAVFCELPLKAQKKFHWAVIGATFTCFVLYLSTGIMGYLNFGGSTQADILVNYPSVDTFANVARAVMAVHIALALPAIVLPCKRALFMLLHVCSHTRAPAACRRCCPLGNGASRCSTLTCRRGGSSNSGSGGGYNQLSTPPPISITQSLRNDPLQQSAVVDRDEFVALSAALETQERGLTYVCGMACGRDAALQNAGLVFGGAALAVLIPQLSLVFGLLGATVSVLQIHMIPACVLLAHALELEVGAKEPDSMRLMASPTPSPNGAAKGLVDASSLVSDGKVYAAVGTPSNGASVVGETTLPRYVPRTPFWLRVQGWSLLVVGGFVMVLGTATNIYNSFIAANK